MEMEREHMFDKVVTPSDVGKLNRLVIPKQHAEKHFPLDSSSNEKGLLLDFEDRNGKAWRFRYSYWNSSQSYVMTKGWSRFVKEMKLDAGDIVSFERGVGELGKNRLFIDWRRRPDAADLPGLLCFPHRLPFRGPIHPCIIPQIFHQAQQPPSSRDYPYLFQRNAIYATHSQFHHHQEQMVHESVPVVVRGKAAAAKRLRLFGVNMDCPVSESDDEYDMLVSSTTLPHSTRVPIHQQFPPPPPNAVPHLQLRPNYSHIHDDKGNGSMSNLNLKI